MLKKLLVIFFLFQTIHAQQLSPVQLQKIKIQFDQAMKAKKFDQAQSYLKQIEQGGRRAYAQELTAELAKAREKEVQAKYQAELHKTHQAEAKRVMESRELEKRKKELEEARRELKKYQEPKDDRPKVPLSVYQRITGKGEYASPHEILGVPSSATKQEIRDAWQNQIRTWNPDRNPQAKDAYMLINWAYKILNK